MAEAVFSRLVARELRRAPSSQPRKTVSASDNTGIAKPANAEPAEPANSANLANPASLFRVLTPS